MACFSTTHFLSQDKHLRAGSPRRSGEGAGSLGEAPRSPPTPPTPDGSRRPPTLQARHRGAALPGCGGSFPCQAPRQEPHAGRVAELTSTCGAQATSGHFAIASKRKGEKNNEIGGKKDPTVSKLKSCKCFPKLVTLGKKVPLLLRRYFITHSSEGKGLVENTHFATYRAYRGSLG